MNRLNNEQALRLANLLCYKLALDLDAGDVSCVDQTADLLQDLPLEVLMIAIRTQIQVERCVRYNLDKHPKFSTILIKVNNSADY